MSDRRAALLAWCPIIFNFIFGAGILWWAASLEQGWGRDSNMIIAGANFGAALTNAAGLLMRGRFWRKEAERDKQEFQAQLAAFKTEARAVTEAAQAKMLAARDDMLDSVLVQVANDIERQTGIKLELRRVKDEEAKRRMH